MPNIYNAAMRKLPRLTLFEVGAVFLGALIRLASLRSYLPPWGYDFAAHSRYLEFFARNHRPPPLDFIYVAYHPPLFYFLGGFLMRHGGAAEDLGVLSVLAGIFKLGLLFYGLRRWLPEKWAPARPIALLLAAVLPCAVHLDLMVNNEPLQTLFAWSALGLIPALFPAPDRPPLGLLGLCGVGVLMGLALLCKVSALVLPLAVGLGAVAEVMTHPFRQGLRRAAGPLLAVAVALALALPVHARFLPTTGKLFPTTYDTGPVERQRYARVQDVPYLARRPLLYLFGLGSGSFLLSPYFPNDSLPDARFFPVLTATAFGDYYNFNYAGPPKPGEPSQLVNVRQMSLRALGFMRASVAGGVLISITVFMALLAAGLALWAKRAIGLLVVAVVPALAVLGQLHFAIKFPFDSDGPVKAHYVQFGAPALFALFGVAVVWLWQRPRLRTLAVAEVGALVLVAAYTLYARF